MTTLAFLDANILAKPCTRTLLMVGAGWKDATDFARTDLDGAGVSAVHFDLLLANRLGPQAYQEALNILAFNKTTPERIHAAAARLHPMLVDTHRDLFPGVKPESSQHNYPTELFRGNCCVRCGKPADSTIPGLCKTCASAIAQPTSM